MHDIVNDTKFINMSNTNQKYIKHVFDKLCETNFNIFLQG